MPTPRATPAVTSATRRSRWPYDVPRLTMAATGAKNGAGWSSRCRASSQATDAATAHWPMCQDRAPSRRTRARTDIRPRRRARGPSSPESSRSRSAVVRVAMTGS